MKNLTTPKPCYGLERRLTSFLFPFLFPVLLNAQSMGISSSSITPDASSIMELRTTTKGLLIPRMTTTERDAITSPATGLMVYNTTTGKFNYYNGSSWTGIFSGSSLVNSITGTGSRITIGGTSSDPSIDISSSYVGQGSITTLGTIGTGVWNGSILTGTYGGTGVNNGSNTITLGGNLVTSGAFNTTLTATGTTNATLPSGTNTLYSTKAGSITSAELLTSLTNPTGTGVAVFGTSPTLTTPVINGLPTGTGVATTATASTLVARDASGNFSAGTITAALTGNASTATMLATGRTIGITGDVTWTSPSFDGSGNVTAAATVTKINGVSMAGLATGILKNTTTTGVPSIAVAGDFPTLNQNTSGSAATLGTARSIYGGSFNGSADLSGIIASTYGGTGNGFAKFSGPATAEKTFTLPNANATILTDNAAVTVAQGGTGVATLASNGVLYGNGTGAVQALAVNSSATIQYLSQVSSGSPSWGSITTLGTISTGVWNGTALTSTYLPAATVYNNQANTYSAGSKQTFTGSSTTAGLNFAGISSDPSALSNGDLWHNTTSNVLKYRANGITRTLANLDESQTLTNKDLSSGTNVFPTFNQNTTGSAATLGTSRSIYGGSFNGSADLTGIIASTYGGTGNGFTKFSGPGTTEKTFTLPNASATILTSNDVVTIAQGGTNSTATPTNGGVGYGDGSAYQFTAAGTAGQVLKSNGAAAPYWDGAQTIVTLGSDVINNNSTANTIADVTGLSFSVTSGVTYRFSALIIYTSAATGTGSRWAINGPASPTLLAYNSQYSLTTTSITSNNANAYDLPAASNANSAFTTSNMCILEGIIKPSANGTVIIRFASETSNSAITAKAGSTLTWW